MSLFKVVLNNEYMGKLDTDPVTGQEIVPSIQRTMFVPGPHGTFRKLIDGAEFEDCNYWKTFAYPNLPHEQAFIEVVVDDGSPYVVGGDNNTFPVVSAGTIAALGSVTIDYTEDYGGYTVFTQISNTGSNAMTVKLNGSSSAVITISAGATQIFNKGDLALGALVIESVDGTDYQVIASVHPVCHT